MYPYICDFWKDMETLSTCVIPVYMYILWYFYTFLDLFILKGIAIYSVKYIRISKG